jgi:hypothetical protein
MLKSLGVAFAWISLCASCANESGNGNEVSPSKAKRQAVPDGATSDARADVVVSMDGFAVPPGGEAYRCQNFANPFGGETVDVDRFEAHMPDGAHHMIVFFVDGIADGPLEECSGSEFHPNVFAAQTPDSVMDMPAGVGVAIPPSSGLRLQIHFINETDNDVTAGVTTRFHVAPPGSIVNHAGQLLFSNEDINVPPAVPTDVTKTCMMPKDVSLLGASAHIHRHAVHFVATAGDRTLYETSGWSDLTPARFDPPIDLREGSPVTFTCSYVNDTTTTLTFGESALTDEMCILGGIYYPVDDTANPNILCL